MKLNVTSDKEQETILKKENLECSFKRSNHFRELKKTSA